MIAVHCSYDGAHNSMKDSAMEKAAGRGSDGSGSGFGTRDMEWYCETEKEADILEKRLSALSFVFVWSN